MFNVSYKNTTKRTIKNNAVHASGFRNCPPSAPQAFLNFVLRSYQIGDAMKIDEYVPQITPTIRGSANALISATPKMKSASTVKNVVADVNKLRVIVCETDLLTRSAVSLLLVAS